MHNLLDCSTWPAAMAAAICLHFQQKRVPPGTPGVETCKQTSLQAAAKHKLDILCLCFFKAALHLNFPDDEQDRALFQCTWGSGLQAGWLPGRC